MDIFTQAEELLKLDSHDPAFIYSHSIISENLAKVKSSSKDIAYATELLRAIDAKMEGYTRTDIRETLKIFRIEYYTGTAKTMTNFIHRIGFKGLLEANDICEKFINIYSNTRDKGMYKPRNHYALKMTVDLVNTFLKDYKEDSSNKWTSFSKLKSFVTLTTKRGLLNIKEVPKVPMIIYKMDSEILKRKRETQLKLSNSDVIALDVFSNKKMDFKMEQYEVYDEEDVANKILYFYLGKPLVLNQYYAEQTKLLDDLTKEGKLTEEQRHYKFLYITGVFESLTSKMKMEPYEPIDVLSLALLSGETAVCLLQYTEEEMNEALRFALYYNKNITKGSIYTLVQEDIESRVAMDKRQYGKVFPETKSDIDYNLKLLARFKIIHEEDISDILKQLY